ALPGLIWAAWFQRWFREWPDEHTGVNAAELAIIRPTLLAETSAQRNERVRVPWLAILTTPALWAICGQQFCRASAFIFYSTWFPRFLEESRSIEPLYAGLMTSLPVLAFVLFATPGG